MAFDKLKGFFSRRDKEPVWERVEDANGHVLPYVLKRAKKPDAPLILILHGNGKNQTPGKFSSPDYNILFPIDQYGLHKNGCWFLGEHGDFFIFEMLNGLIKRLLAEDGIKKELYIWGSSMGGYASFIYGLSLGAHAIFCHIPQTNFHDSHWYMKNKPFIDHIFAKDDMSHPLRDIPACLDNHEGFFPLIFLSFNRFDRPFYNEENMDPVISTLNRLQRNYFLIVHPQTGHALHQRAAEHIAYFDFYKREIGENYASQMENKNIN